MKRRDFLSGSAKVAAAGFAAPYILPSHVLAAPGRIGANDRLRVGFIGVGGRARQLLGDAEGIRDHADVVAVADCFLHRIDAAAETTPESDKWVRYQNYQDMLEKEKLDAVFIPTTTHARALIAHHALAAGLDVYAEKPIALTVQEGRSLVKAARKMKRVFQAGTQQRSMPISIFASRLVREGRIGKVHTVQACNFTGPLRWKPQPAEDKPEGLDWNQWCNQTELRPYRKDLHYGWAQWWDYDGGGRSWGVSGWGTHALDQVQCALGTDDTGPVEVWPHEPDAEGWVPVTMKYENGTLLKCHGPRRTREQAPELPDLGATFIGEEGYIEIKRGTCLTNRQDLFADAPPDSIYLAEGETRDHIANFFECVRSRKQPNADVEIAHRATIVCILMNVCRDLNRRLKWDPKTERFMDDDEANRTLSRERREGFELPKEFI